LKLDSSNAVTYTCHVQTQGIISNMQSLRHQH
jgi:hypothetical protein